MEYILFAGAPNTGKTESIYRLTNNLLENKGYKLVEGEIPKTCRDFSCIIKKGEIKILIHSYTDLPSCINVLKEFYKENSDIDLIITAARDISDPMRQRLINELNISPENVFEIPFGKVKRGGSRQMCIDWFLDNMEILALKIVEMKF